MRMGKLTVTMIALVCGMTTAQAATEVVAQPVVAEARPVVTEKLLADTYVRLQKLSQGGLSVRNYQLAKALAFIDEARREFYMRNHSGIVLDFVESAQVITDALEKGTVIGTVNRQFETSEAVAPALWRRIERLKGAAMFACNGDKVARAEVELLAAGNDQYLLGWRAAVARIQLAEQQLDLAEQVATC